MRINHLNLAVPDVTKAREFFERYFGLRCAVERGRGTIAVLVDESGFVLSLSNFHKVASVEYPGKFHVGFMQESVERVDEMHAQLTAAGLEAKPPREFHGARTFYLRGPGGIMIEVGHQHRMAEIHRLPEPIA